MDDKKFENRNRYSIKKLGKNQPLKKLSNKWMVESSLDEYSYHFSWLGRPIIQFPQDMIAVQEIIWKIKPDLIIETGIARGGSLIFSASILEIIGKGKVLGIDIDIRKHNKTEIKKHPMNKRITMIEGSSIDEKISKQVFDFAKGNEVILVMLDSNHTHKHVLKEMELYSPLVTKDSYLIVFDTIIEDMPKNSSSDRDWDKGNNPKTAVWEFLKKNNRFEIDKEIENKLLITVAPDGYLKCIED